MKIALVTPARPVSHSGNRNTALRWASLLRELGHRVRVQTAWDGKAADVMIALHARRSHDSIAGFAHRYPGRALVVMLTGTDLYRDIRTDAGAKLSLELATRLVVLQDQGAAELAPRLAAKNARHLSIVAAGQIRAAAQILLRSLHQRPLARG